MAKRHFSFHLRFVIALLGLMSALATPRALAVFGIRSAAFNQTNWEANADAQAEDCIPAPSGMVSWWPMDGNGNDFFVVNSPVEVGGNPQFVSGTGAKVAQAMSFDGLDDHVRISGSASTDVGTGTGFTIDMWIKPQNISTQRPLIEWHNSANPADSGNEGVHLWISVPLAGDGGPGSLFVNMKDTSGGNHLLSSAPGVITANSYHHVALVYAKSGGNGFTTLLVDGNVVAGPVPTTTNPQTGFNLYFGLRPGAERFIGEMDEIELYNRALSQAEIQAIFNAGTAGKCKTRYVRNINDSGPDSLRQAIRDSNNYRAPNTIAFKIEPAGGVKTISPSIALDVITGPVTIDGTTQQGYAGTPVVELNCTQVFDGLRIEAPVTIKGLAINRLFGIAIDLSAGSSGSVIVGNHIGTNASGTVSLGNARGIVVGTALVPVDNVRIGGTTAQDRNIISGNQFGGIIFTLTSNNIVQGNYIGTDVSGTIPMPNGVSGISVQSYLNNGNHTIGG